MRSCRVIELGLIRYAEALALQERLVAARKTGAAPDVLLLCQHPHVITIGRNGKLENLLAPPAELQQMGVDYHDSNRGGDITYHGPGQLVGYPILNLGEIRRDIAWYVRQLEEAMMQASSWFGVETFRVPGRAGVWTKSASGAKHFSPNEEKLGAIGVHLSRWVTSHGFAYNVSTDLRYFELIVPCGIAGRSATSLEKVLGRPVSMSELTPHIIAAFGDVFSMEIVPAELQDVEHWLAESAACGKNSQITVSA